MYGPEPTFWQWVQFWATMTVLFGGLGWLAFRRLPEWMRAGLVAMLRHIPGALFEAFRLLTLGLAWLGGLFLWVLTLGHEPFPFRPPVIEVGRRPAPAVNRFAGSTSGYVTSGAGVPPHDPPSSSPSVRPSVETMPNRPDLPPALAGIIVDRSRESLILALVAAGWNTEQIRAVVSGANAKIGEEVKAARERLEAGELLATTPIAERPTAAEFRRN